MTLYQAPSGVRQYNSSLRSLIQRFIEHSLDQDDVYHQDFLETLYIQSSETTIESSGKYHFLEFREHSVPVQWLRLHSSEIITPGPYAQDPSGFKRISKLFRDSNNAFTRPIMMDSTHGTDFKSPSKCGHLIDDERLLIAVPSRLYYKRTPTNPLSGLRFAVKDNIDVEGTKTGAGSLAYQRLHDMKNITSSCVRHLLALGAVLVGKTRTAQFANGDTTTGDWVEAPCPWNPRGDGYLIPSGSSSGSASAIAAYCWLDFSVGTDCKSP